MGRSKLWISLFAWTALAVPAFLVFAGQNDDRARSDAPRSDAPADPDDVKPDDRARDDRPRDDRPHHVESLGRTIKLEFKLIGDDEEPTFTVLCATRHFSIVQDESSPDFEHSLRFTGELHRVDAEGRVLVTFEAMMAFADLNEGSDDTFSAEGSAIVRLGKQLMIAQLAEGRLMLTATVQE